MTSPCFNHCLRSHVCRVQPNSAEDYLEPGYTQQTVATYSKTCFTNNDMLPQPLSCTNLTGDARTTMFSAGNLTDATG